jgi:Protein of unknown function (DUF3768)
MAGSEQDHFARETGATLKNPRTARIAELNDQLRCHARGGQIAITAGVIGLGNRGVQAALEAVRNFDKFTTDNDPYGEHDFGALTVQGHKVFWKIDYYDRAMQFGSPDPADPDVTTRVLTIMLSEEY